MAAMIGDAIAVQVGAFARGISPEKAKQAPASGELTTGLGSP